jgi:hypothetical protein
MKSLYQAMLDPDLFGRTFGGPTFEAWRTVAKIMDGLPLTESEHALYQRITGRTQPPCKPFREGYLIKPRRAGGTLFAAAVGLQAALQDYRDKLGPGEVATVAMIASDRRQARQLMNYVKGLIDGSALIAGEVTNQTQETISFEHRVNLEVHTTSFRSTRGYSYAAVILDELAFFRDDLSANPDIELVRAVRPGLANLGGRLLGLSSPHSRRGHLYAMHRAHFGKDSDVLVIQAGGPVLNPTIGADVIERARAEDPVAARSEWDAQFREDISSYIDDALVDVAIPPGVMALTRSPGVQYYGFTDPAGGGNAGSDAFSLGIAHQDRGGRVMLDKLVWTDAPFVPETVVERYAEVLSAFGVQTVHGDKYAGEWPASMFRKYGVTYTAAQKPKSDIYLEVAPLFAAKRIELLDIARLGTELRLLERKPRGGGRGDQVDHGPNGHDDLINGALGACWIASTRPIAQAQDFPMRRGEHLRGQDVDPFDPEQSPLQRRAREPRVIRDSWGRIYNDE